MRADRRLVWALVRYAVLAGAVLLAAVPLYFYLEVPGRALVPRGAAALVLGIALLELRGTLALRLADQGASALDAALVPPPVDDGVPHRLRETEASLRAALRSRRHFERVLWPRLVALADRPLTPPPPRRARGPRLRDVEALVARIEGER
jgi:hypothetical protein